MDTDHPTKPASQSLVTETTPRRSHNMSERRRLWQTPWHTLALSWSILGV